MNQRIVFVWPNYNMHVSYGPNIGILAAVAKRYGADVFVYHVHSELGNPPAVEKCAEDISTLNPTIIGITSSTFEWSFVKELALNLRGKTCAKLVLGGSHATFCKNDDGFNLFDFVVVGEGEKIITDLLFGKNPDSKIVTGQMIEDLDSLPFMDRGSFKMQKIINARGGLIDFIAQRGCPHNCNYCSNFALRDLYGNKFLRQRSVDNVIGEINEVKNTYNFSKIFFHDDIFTLRRNWVMEFCERYKREINLPLLINSHVNCLPDDILAMLAKSGCVEIKMGIESGDEEIRKKVLNRNVSNEVIKSRFEAIREKGIRSYAYMMQGVPDSTEKTYERNILLMKDILPNIIRSTIFFPLPNTVLGNNQQYRLNGEITASTLGDSPTSIFGEKNLLEYYLFGWNINLCLGISEYKDFILKYSTPKNLNVDELKYVDKKISAKMAGLGKIHYAFGNECSMLKLINGSKSLF